ncbi:MAG: hypothetical protein HGA86_05445 [Anaerolineaceae bacterium]|nr:hypothetical protein [Anaerolineaceae bacterium]
MGDKLYGNHLTTTWFIQTDGWEEALARVREHHPWARPDSHHWLVLRWLARHVQSPLPL